MSGTTRLDSEVECLTDPEEVRDRIRLLCEGARDAVSVFAPDGLRAIGDGALGVEEAELLARGVRVRVIYPDQVRDSSPGLDCATLLADMGVQVRIARSLPLRMLVVDRSAALLREPCAGAALLLSGTGFVSTLRSLFEAKWRRAVPFGWAGTDHQGLSTTEAMALRLLALGHTDDAIARRLGVSSRTARRIAADLMQELGARSRFQAGALAALYGLITVEDIEDENW
ncbi:LuxR C-terminal-related transcriptional regulator [Actinosynnema sp. NPDC050801]|uniref:helix-turn-helix transcriptional regulator n=1 Tax=unclassified Actinosynnema TaxID=2637065 RepID=UPI0033FC6B60